MGTLTNTSSHQTVQLRDHHIVGRHPETAHTLVKNNTVSRSHCLVEWQQNAWYLQDISANGTFINGKRVAKNIKHPLKLNDKIQFGDTANETWLVSNIKSPSAFLKSTNTAVNDIALPNQVNLLSSGDNELMISKTLSGQWLCEQAGNVLDAAFVLWTANDIDATQDCLEQHAHTVKVLFRVSQNEEHVGITIDIDGQAFDLEDRTHHYLVLLVARKYLEDKQQNIPDSEAGWLDKSLLIKQTRMEETHINTQFFRFKKQLHNALKGSKLDINVIERRRGEIRVQCNEILINNAKVA